MHLLLFLLAATTTDPCVLLTEKDVREILEIPATTPVRNARAASCTYVWLGANPSARELRDALKNNKQRPTRPGESVSIFVETIPDPIKEIEGRFEKVSKGFKVERDGEQKEVKPQRTEWVSSIGEKAFWIPALGELVVANKGTIISVVLKKKALSESDLAVVASRLAQTAIRKQ